MAISTLVRASHWPLRAFVATLLLSSQDVNDVAQEVFLRAIERLDRVTDVDALGPFLRGIARNIIRERQRRFARERQSYTRFAEGYCGTDLASEKASWLADPELLAALQGCLQGLQENSREILTLRCHDEMNSDQIGEISPDFCNEPQAIVGSENGLNSGEVVALISLEYSASRYVGPHSRY